MKRFRILLAGLLLAASGGVYAQKVDAEHLSISASGRFSHVLDSWDLYRNLLNGSNYDMYDLKVGLHTRRGEGGWFERAYNYPGFGLGFSYQRMGSLPCKGISRIGDIFNLYGWAEFDFVRTRHFRLGPALELGVAYTPEVYHPVTNPENMYVGSKIFALIGGGLQAEWLFAPRWSLVAGAWFTHHSNGMIVVPNLGLNEISFNAGIRYRIAPTEWEHGQGPKLERPEYEKGLHWNFFAAGGGHASYLELESAIVLEMPPEKWFPIPTRARAVVGVEGVWRYHPVFATGLGVDVNYAENRYREVDLLRLGREDPQGYSPIYCGIYLIQEFWYRRVSVHLNAGIHFFKKTGLTENMGLDYERIGIRYHFRRPKGLFAGLNLRIHYFDSSYCQEWCVGYSL